MSPNWQPFKQRMERALGSFGEPRTVVETAVEPPHGNHVVSVAYLSGVGFKVSCSCGWHVFHDAEPMPVSREDGHYG